MSDKMLALDHLMVHVPSSEDAGCVMEKLGFSATPKSNMPGLSNRLICFSETPVDLGVCNYIELMQLEDAKTAPPPMPELLKAYGPVSTVLCVDDAHAVRARLAGEQFELTPVLDLQRDWALPNGEVITPAFSVVIPKIGQAPIYWNYCLHKTPHHYVRPEFVKHPNGAIRFDMAYALSKDSTATIEHYVKFWQARVEDGALVLPHGPSLKLLGEDELEDVFPHGLVEATDPGLLGVRIVVRDIAAARDLISAAGTHTLTLPDGFGVKASDAMGCALIFREAE